MVRASSALLSSIRPRLSPKPSPPPRLKRSWSRGGLAPILAWAKALIDDIMASEFDAPDLEFVWSASDETDPATQETILSGYTSNGILTINEARAVLGRAPLMEASANRPMTLTNAGFVPLPA
jgi:hypothetical protein